MNILILAKDYPPLNVIAAQRPAYWFKYLNEMGHTARVVTGTYATGAADTEGVVRIKTDLYGRKTGWYLLVRRARSFFEGWLPFIWPMTSRYVLVYRAAEKLIFAEKPDLIIATGEPFVLFGLAHRLSRFYAIPWVADYRDPWSTHPDHNNRPIASRVLQSRAECRWVSTAVAVTTASNAYKERVEAATDHRSVHVVHNGHHLTQIPERLAIAPAFRLAYAGRLYPHQPIDHCLIAFQIFMAEVGYPKDVEFHFLGLGDWPAEVNRIRALAGPCEAQLRFFPQMAYADYMSRLASAQLYVLLSQKKMAWLNAKVFDYMVLPGEVMLYPSGDGVLEDLLKEGEKGQVADSITDMTAIMREAYRTYVKGGEDPYPFRLARFSRKESTDVLASILEKALTTFRSSH